MESLLGARAAIRTKNIPPHTEKVIYLFPSLATPSLHANLVLPKLSTGEKQIEKNTSLETLPIQLILTVGVNALILKKHLPQTNSCMLFICMESMYISSRELYSHVANRIWINLAVYS